MMGIDKPRGRGDVNFAKSRIARGFLKGRSSYEREAVVQHRIADELIAMIEGQGRVPFARALEIGCCTGYLTEKAVQNLSLSTLYVNDLVPEFQEDIENRIGRGGKVRLVPCFGDIEKIAIPQKLDLIFSSASLQWIEDLEGILARLACSLQNDGILAFSIQGPKTLYEFRSLTGVGLSYYSLDELVFLLERHYQILASRQFEEQILVPTPRHMLKHLQATGVNGVSNFRWTPSSLRAFEKEYVRRFAQKDGVPVSYESYLFIVRKAV